jgi:hypothetical protein
VIHFCKFTRKIRYKRKDQAHNAMLNVQRRGIVTNGQMSAYPCQGCGGWHFGHVQRQFLILPRKMAASE